METWQSCTGCGCLPSDTKARPVNALYLKWSYETSLWLMHKLSKENTEGDPEKERWRKREKRRAWQVFLLRLQLTLISVWGLALMPAPVMYVCACGTCKHTSKDVCSQASSYTPFMSSAWSTPPPPPTTCYFQLIWHMRHTVINECQMAACLVKCVRGWVCVAV